MDKSVLSQINSIREEIKEINKMIDDINKRPMNVVIDSVKGSSEEYPYTQHNVIVEGVDNKKVLSNKRNRNKYKKQIKSKEYKLGKLINKLEYELNYIEDSEMRTILRYKYEQGMTYFQVANEMNKKPQRAKEYTADGIRMQIKRFFEKS